MRNFRIIVERYADGYVRYQLGLKGVVVGQGDTYEEALADVKSAIRFHIETFGKDAFDADVEKVAETSRAFETVEKYSYRATVDEIAENDFNLNIPRYVDTFEEEDPVDIIAVQQEIETLEQELASVRGELDGYLKELNLVEG